MGSMHRGTAPDSTAVKRLGALVSVALVLATPSGAQELRWTIEAEPTVQIGSLDGRDEYVFTFPQAGVVLSDGRIVLTEGSRRHFWIRYYDASGRFLRSTGGFGEGPHEFRTGAHVFARLPGDSLLVANLSRRFSVFGPDGEGARTGRFDEAKDPLILGILGGTHLLTMSTHLVRGRDGGPGIAEYESQLNLVQLDTGTVLRVRSGLASRGAFGERGLILHLPFDPGPLWAVGGNRVWAASSADAQIEGTGIDGSSVTAAVPWQAHRVTPEEARAWQNWDLRGKTGEVLRIYRRHHRSIAFPDQMPHLGALSVDNSGRLWVLRYEPPWSDAPLEWQVFSAAGRPVANVVAPLEVVPDLRREPMSSPLLDIGEDYILVRTRDEWGVVRVARHALTNKRIP